MEDKNKASAPKAPIRPNLNKIYSTSNKAKPMAQQDKANVGAKTSIVGSQNLSQPTAKPKNKKKFWSIFIVVILAILVAVSLTLILIWPRPIRPADISLEFETDVKLTGLDAIIERNPNDPSNIIVMPGDTFGCAFTVKTQKNEQSTGENLDVFVRIKAGLIVDDNYYDNLISINFASTSAWYKGNDGYYYMQKWPKIDESNPGNPDGVLSPGENIGDITKSIKLSEEIGNSFAGKKMQIVFYAEALQAQYQAIGEMWPTSPVEWKSQFKNLSW